MSDRQTRSQTAAHQASQADLHEGSSRSESPDSNLVVEDSNPPGTTPAQPSLRPQSAGNQESPSTGDAEGEEHTETETQSETQPEDAAQQENETQPEGEAQPESEARPAVEVDAVETMASDTPPPGYLKDMRDAGKDTFTAQPIQGVLEPSLQQVFSKAEFANSSYHVTDEVKVRTFLHSSLSRRAYDYATKQEDALTAMSWQDFKDFFQKHWSSDSLISAEMQKYVMLQPGESLSDYYPRIVKMSESESRVGVIEWFKDCILQAIRTQNAQEYYMLQKMYHQDKLNEPNYHHPIEFYLAKLQSAMNSPKDKAFKQQTPHKQQPQGGNYKTKGQYSGPNNRPKSNSDKGKRPAGRVAAAEGSGSAPNRDDVAQDE